MRAVSLDLTLLDLDDVPAVDAVGEYLDGAYSDGASSNSGGELIAGVVPATGAPGPDLAEPAADLLTGLWNRLGLDPERLPEQVSVSTTCGMAGASPDYARAAMEASREAARRLHG